jgi:hypothetical protein
MGSDHEFGLATGSAESGSSEAGFAAIRTGENKFAIAYGHAMELRRVVEAEQAALHTAAGGELGQHSGEVTSGALHTAGSVEFGEDSDEHPVSLPSAGTERKRDADFVAGQFPSRDLSQTQGQRAGSSNWKGIRDRNCVCDTARMTGHLIATICVRSIRRDYSVLNRVKKVVGWGDCAAESKIPTAKQVSEKILAMDS